MTEKKELIFRDIESKLIEIITKLSYQKGRSSKFSIIAAYAYVRENITQKKLQKITHFSRGTISTSLNKLVNDNVLQKQYDSESHQFVYQLKGTLQSILGGSTANIGSYFSSISDKLKEVETQLNQKDMKDKKGYKNIQDFIQKMKIILPAYDHIIRKYQTSISPPEKKVNTNELK
ncbi:hypothetical protein NEF87_000873 [Candidatus Lokiarchaeum ossiferum]|uniref:MarR family transcriptional regulator n=1 Tax=Candidatus Lokiarchaeum ossiferum TaxID=2951803 RepID=A0ABY6HM46_9ARCH|nr:hypothetical protein NEF87_000873 [Candidatus Lokiarchaeum sp. B-35]